jgi:hypothetical protein
MFLSTAIPGQHCLVAKPVVHGRAERSPTPCHSGQSSGQINVLAERNIVVGG